MSKIKFDKYGDELEIQELLVTEDYDIGHYHQRYLKRLDPKTESWTDEPVASYATSIQSDNSIEELLLRIIKQLDRRITELEKKEQ